MYYWTPKRIKELKARGYKLRQVPHDPGPELTSSQATQPSPQARKPKAQASSRKPQAPGPSSLGTSEPSPYPGHKQQE